jgi:hypothetical protein
MNGTNALYAIPQRLFINISTFRPIKYALELYRKYGPKVTTSFSHLWNIQLDYVSQPTKDIRMPQGHRSPHIPLAVFDA